MTFNIVKCIEWEWLTHFTTFYIKRLGSGQCNKKLNFMQCHHDVLLKCHNLLYGESMGL